VLSPQSERPMAASSGCERLLAAAALAGNGANPVAAASRWPACMAGEQPTQTRRPARHAIACPAACWRGTALQRLHPAGPGSCPSLRLISPHGTCCLPGRPQSGGSRCLNCDRPRHHTMAGAGRLLAEPPRSGCMVTGGVRRNQTAPDRSGWKGRPETLSSRLDRITFYPALKAQPSANFAASAQPNHHAVR